MTVGRTDPDRTDPGRKPGVPGNPGSLRVPGGLPGDQVAMALLCRDDLLGCDSRGAWGHPAGFGRRGPGARGPGRGRARRHEGPPPVRQRARWRRRLRAACRDRRRSAGSRARPPSRPHADPVLRLTGRGIKRPWGARTDRSGRGSTPRRGTGRRSAGLARGRLSDAVVARLSRPRACVRGQGPGMPFAPR